MVWMAMPPIRFPAASPRFPFAAAEIVMATSGRLPASERNTRPPIASPKPKRWSSASVVFEREMPASQVAAAPATKTTIRMGVESDDTDVADRLQTESDSVSAWLELAQDKGLVVHFADINEDCTLDLDDLQLLLSDRTRVVAFPVASNAVGTVSDPRRIAELAHETGALAWADAVHYGPHGPIDVAGWDVDVLICSPYKFFGPHLGLAWGKRALLESWRPYKVRPAAMEPLGHRFETGTLPHEQLAGFVAAVEYLDSIGWDAIRSHERELGQRFLDGLLESVTLYGLPTMDGRVATFAFNVAGYSARAAPTALGDRGFAVWQGNYYALEIMRRLGLGDEGAVRAGMVHYNTLEEVDRLLGAIAAL